MKIRSLQKPRGYLFGHWQQTVIYEFSVPPRLTIPIVIDLCKKAVGELVPVQAWDLPDDVNIPEPIKNLIIAYVNLLRAFEVSSGGVLVEDPTFLGLKQRGKSITFVMAMPTLDQKLSISSVRSCNLLLRNFTLNDSAGLDEELRQYLTEKVNRVSKVFPLGKDWRLFVKAAHELGIPFFKMIDGTFRFGLGDHAADFRFTQSDRTSSIGLRRARDKYMAARFLSAAGIPVPETHAFKRSDLDSLKLSDLGEGPYVLKPRSLDAGLYIYTDVENGEEIRDLVNSIPSKVENFVVQQQITAKEYRANVADGEILALFDRAKIEFTGDGEKTLRELVDAMNQHTMRRGIGRNDVEKINLTDRMLEFLRRDRKDLSYIPQKGEVVSLSGGVIMDRFRFNDVIDVVHPDNLALIRSLGKIIKLDIYGVDFFTNDLSQSWKDGGLTVMEVNGLPLLSKTTQEPYRKLLKKRIPSLPEVTLTISKTSETRVDPIYTPGMKFDIMTSVAEIRKNGLPVPYFNHLEIDPEIRSSVTPGLLALIEPHHVTNNRQTVSLMG